MIRLFEKYGFYPRAAVWELTLRCNLNCRHCGSRAGHARADELSLGEALGLCRDLAELKCRQVTLGGGEPTLRKDWPLIAEKLGELGIRVGMISNGVGWNDALSRTARTVGLDTAGFSLDGLEDTHEYVRRAPGHFREVLGAFDSCAKAGVRPSAITTINKRNLPELEQLRELLAEHGVRRWQVQLATPTGNLADNRDLVLDPEDVLAIVPLVARYRRDGLLPKIFPGHDIGYYGEPEEFLRDPNHPIPFWTGCSAGLSTIGIESNGGIKGCLSLPSAQNGVDEFLEGNIRDTPLCEIWERRGAFAYTRQFTVEQLGGFCRTCEYGEICRGGCTWMTYSQSRAARDNPYCYHRQLTLRERGEPCHSESGESGATEAARVRLPLAR